MNLYFWALLALVIAILGGAVSFTRRSRPLAIMGRVLFGVFALITIVLFALIFLGYAAGPPPEAPPPPPLPFEGPGQV